MAKKVILKDHDNNEIMPITRGELILDSSGNEALHSNEFLATDTKPGLMSKEDKLKLINMSAGAYGDADTVDGKHASDFLSITGGTMQGTINLIQDTSYIKNSTTGYNILGINNTIINNTGVVGNRVFVGDATLPLTLRGQEDLIHSINGNTYPILDTNNYKTYVLCKRDASVTIRQKGWLRIFTTNYPEIVGRIYINQTYVNNANNPAIIDFTFGYVNATKPLIKFSTSSSRQVWKKIRIIQGSYTTDYTDGYIDLYYDGTVSETSNNVYTFTVELDSRSRFDKWSIPLTFLPDTYTPPTDSYHHTYEYDISKGIWTNENITSPLFTGNLDGIYINKLTNYTKATSISDIVATDSLNSALGKLEYKAGVTYDWYKSITQDDTDTIINKWGEIVDFIDSVAEGTDITDEFVTRKTEQTITGAKTFEDSVTISYYAPFILSGTEKNDIYHTNHSPQYNWRSANNNSAGMPHSLNFKWYNNVWNIGALRGGSTNTIGFGIGLSALDSDGNFYIKSSFRIDETASYVNEHEIYHTGNLSPVLNQSLANYVTLATDQIINGVKTFRNQLNLWTSIQNHQSPLHQCLVINSTEIPSDTSLTIQNAPGIGFHIRQSNWGNLVYDGKFNFTNGNMLSFASVKASSYIVENGTSSQFLKADGSVDSTSYATSTSLSNYLPLTGGTLTGNLTISGDKSTIIRNIKFYTTGGWARVMYALQVDGVTKFTIGGYGVYTTGATDNGINYAYIGCNSWDGANLRISPTELKWGDATVLHAYNYNSYALPLSGGTITSHLEISSSNDYKLILNNTDNEQYYQLISFRQSGTQYGYLGTQGTTNLVWSGATILHAYNYTSYTPILNSSSTHATNTSVIYAPTTSGTSGQYLMSNGSGAPVWTSLPALASPYAIKFKNTAGTEVSYNGSVAIDLTSGIEYATNATRIKINNTPIFTTGGLHFLQTQGDTDILPDTEWHSIIRAQHSGYTNGYWQDLALPFYENKRIQYRVNRNGTKHEWKSLAYTSDIKWSNLADKPTTISGYGITDTFIVKDDNNNYINLSMPTAALAKKANTHYIECWDSAGGWWNWMAGKWITAGGTSSQFVKGDGTLDSNTYVTGGPYLPLAGGIITGKTIITGISYGNSSIINDLDALIIVPKTTRIGTVESYYPGIAFNHLYNHNYTSTYNDSPQGWIGLRLYSTTGSELSYLTFATKTTTGITDRPTEKMCIAPNGNVGINTTSPSYKLDVNGNTHIQNNIETHGHMYMYSTSNYIMFNKNAEGIYIHSNGISWHNTNNAWTKTLISCNNNGTVHIPNILMSGTSGVNSEINLIGKDSQLKFFAYEGRIYIESGNINWNEQRPMYITGLTGTNGSDLHLCFNYIKTHGKINLDKNTGIQMDYTSGGSDPWIYPLAAPNYGIRYYEGTPDKMAISASGNNNTIAGADLCINGNGDGTVTIRGNTILHTGNIDSNNLTTISKTLTVTQDWMDTGIDGDDFLSGTYIIQVTCSNESNLWDCYWSGVMSWWKGRTNDTESDEIILHRAGRSYDKTIYLRTIMRTNTDSNGLKLQIASNDNIGSSTYTFKFKRVI